MATELPGTGAALAHGSGSSSGARSGSGTSGGSHERAPIASVTSRSAAKLWPEDVDSGIGDRAAHATGIRVRVVALLVADAAAVVGRNNDVELRAVAHLGVGDRDVTLDVRHLLRRPGDAG